MDKHTIFAKQLEGTTTSILASSANATTGEKKQLLISTTINAVRFSVFTQTSFIVKVNDKTVHTSDHLYLAIQSYNKY